MLRLRCLLLVARSCSTPAPPAPPPQTARPGTSHQCWTLRAIGYRLLDGEVTTAHRPSQNGPPCSGNLSAAPAYSAIPGLWSPAVAGHLAICGDQCVPTQIIIRPSFFATTIRLLLAFFFSPVWWPLVILLLPGVALLSRWMAKLQKPLIGSQASWWKHTFVPGKQRVRAWALAVCVRASDNLRGPFFRQALIALPCQTPPTAACRIVVCSRRRGSAMLYLPPGIQRLGAASGEDNG